MLKIIYQDGSIRNIRLDSSFFNDDKNTVPNKCMAIAYDTGDPYVVECTGGKETFFKKLPKKEFNESI